MKTFEERLVPTYCEFEKHGTVVVFDTETTGLEDSDDVVQIACVVMKDGKETIAQTVYLKNQVPIDGTEAQKVNGITDEFLRKEGLEPEGVLLNFLELLNNSIREEGKVLLVAHNLSFDLRMIENMLKRYNLPPIPKGTVYCCTKEFVKSLKLPKEILPGNHLQNCIKAFDLNAQNTHDALDDTRACFELFKFLAD